MRWHCVEAVCAVALRAVWKLAQRMARVVYSGVLALRAATIAVGGSVVWHSLRRCVPS